MLPTSVAHSPPGRAGRAGGAPLPPWAAEGLAHVRRSPPAACGVGFVLALLLTRLFSGGGGSGGAACPPLPPPSALLQATAALPHAPSPPTAYIRLDAAATSTQPWRPGSAATLPPPRSNGLLDLGRLGEGGGAFLPEEAARPRGAAAVPTNPAVSVVLPVVTAEAAAAAASTAAAANTAGGGVEVVVVAATPAAATAFGEAAAAAPTAFRLLTRTGPALDDPASAYAAALNDGVRAARAPLVATLAPGDRVGRGAWAALAAGAAAHPDADAFYTGPAVPRPRSPGGDEARDGGDDGDGDGPLPAEAPWHSPTPPGAAFRKDRVWAAGGGFPAVPAPGRPARAAAEAGLWAAAAAAHGGTLAAVSVGPDALVGAGGGDALPPSLRLPHDLAASLAVAMAGGPLPPAAVVRAHVRVLAAAKPGAPHREGLAAAATALARATSLRGCPATAPADLLLGLLHEAAGDGRIADAAAAYARSAACADGAGVPALAWAARVRGDAARAADLARCVRRADAAAEPGSLPRPASGNAHADAAECVAVLGVAT